MKRNMALGISLAILLGVPAYAGNCHVRQQIVVASQSAVFIPQGYIAVPFAVPVAVPSYVQYQAVVAPPAATESAAIATQDDTARAQEAPVPPTLVARSCVKCHSGATPKGKLDLSGELTPELRLKMIGRILADSPEKRMPKGKPLDAQAIGLILQEISRPEPQLQE